jgi:hypothetical protein
MSHQLPIYLEHVLLPTLTDAGCYTEVHHVDGTGHDAGYVLESLRLSGRRGVALMVPQGGLLGDARRAE